MYWTDTYQILWIRYLCAGHIGNSARNCRCISCSVSITQDQAFIWTVEMILVNAEKLNAVCFNHLVIFTLHAGGKDIAEYTMPIMNRLNLQHIVITETFGPGLSLACVWVTWRLESGSVNERRLNEASDTDPRGQELRCPWQDICLIRIIPQTGRKLEPSTQI